MTCCFSMPINKGRIYIIFYRPLPCKLYQQVYSLQGVMNSNQSIVSKWSLYPLVNRLYSPSILTCRSRTEPNKLEYLWMAAFINYLTYTLQHSIVLEWILLWDTGVRVFKHATWCGCACWAPRNTGDTWYDAHIIGHTLLRCLLSALIKLLHWCQLEVLYMSIVFTYADACRITRIYATYFMICIHKTK